MNNRETSVNYDAISQISLEQFGDNFPGMIDCVGLIEVILAAIAWNFEL